jgi:hypothetical protein
MYLLGYAGEHKLIQSVYPYFVLQNQSKMVRGIATQCMTEKCGQGFVGGYDP